MTHTAETSTTLFDFDNQFVQQFPELAHEQVPEGLNEPDLIVANQELAQQLQWPIDENLLTQVGSGSALIEGMRPLAQKYSGHQFGQYNPYLGDGRGLLLAEQTLTTNQRVDIHLKGAGKTPYSRHGDGYAVMRSCVREFLASEALHALGVPTTRALSVVTGQDVVQREHPEQRAMLLRVARTHIRFGHFEHCYHRGLKESSERLISYVCETQWPDLIDQPRRAFFQRIVETTAKMIAHWQVVGFAHGVMNTDNMSIVGETFDFGPFQFMDGYQPQLICNRTDQQGRYAFDQQPSIGLWNLNVLAMALSPFIDSDELVASLKTYQHTLEQHYWQLQGQRFGLQPANDGSLSLMQQFMSLLQHAQADYSRSFRALAVGGDDDFAALQRELGEVKRDAKQWIQSYQDELKDGLTTAFTHARKRYCPAFVLRNHTAQLAIEGVAAGDASYLERLYQVLRKPFDEDSESNDLQESPPEWAEGLALSCSS